MREGRVTFTCPPCLVPNQGRDMPRLGMEKERDGFTLDIGDQRRADEEKCVEHGE